MLKFFLECFKKTKPAFRIARNTAFILALLIPGGTALYNDFSKEPISVAITSALMWQIPLGILALIGILQFFLAPYWVHEDLKKQHLRELTELREARRQELYTYVPEANIERIFRIFFNLYKYGEFLKRANTARRQNWDDEVIRALMDYCGETTKNNYLLDTGRRWGIHDPLLDVNYDNAVSRIKEMVFSDNFSGYINLR